MAGLLFNRVSQATNEVPAVPIQQRLRPRRGTIPVWSLRDAVQQLVGRKQSFIAKAWVLVGFAFQSFGQETDGEVSVELVEKQRRPIVRPVRSPAPSHEDRRPSGRRLPPGSAAPPGRRPRARAGLRGTHASPSRPPEPLSCRSRLGCAVDHFEPIPATAGPPIDRTDALLSELGSRHLALRASTWSRNELSNV